MSISELPYSKEIVSSHSSLTYAPVQAVTTRPPVRHSSTRSNVAGQSVQKGGKVTADSILRSFNTWAFKREQPDNIDLLRISISKSIDIDQPIPFVLYWGKGLRTHQAEEDIRCLDFLNTMTDRIGEAYKPGASFTLIFTDTHAELNGHRAEATWQYFSEVWQSAEARKFLSCTLSDLVAANGAWDGSFTAPTASLLTKLHASASRWYRGKEPILDAAKKYYAMNMRERAAVQAAFPNSIFITFNGSSMRPLFPEHMPIFYMYSLKRGTSVKPWFLPVLECPQNAQELVSVDP